MTHSKKIISLLLVMVVTLSLSLGFNRQDLLAEAEEPWEIALKNKYFNYDVTDAATEASSHLQGICVDDEMKYAYLSYTDTLLKLDLASGEVVGSVCDFGPGSITAEGGAHIGCLAYYNGKVYGSLEYKSPGKKFFLVVFDPSKITEIGMSFQDMEEGVDAVLLAEPTADFRDPLNDEPSSDDGTAVNNDPLGHRFGCSGIDGVTFARLPGDDSDKIYCLVAYGIFANGEEWQQRYDNNYNIIQVYDPEMFDEHYDPETGEGDSVLRRFVYERGIDMSFEENEALNAVDTYYVWTGTTTWGCQNLEAERDSRDIVLYTYSTPKKGWEKWSQADAAFVIDGEAGYELKELEVGQSNKNSDQEIREAALSKADCYKVDGIFPEVKHLSLKCICGEDCQAQEWADTGYNTMVCGAVIDGSTATFGIVSLGNDYYFMAHDKYQMSLFQRDENFNFTLVGEK
ncbi:MAG: hypothetical protein Q4E09_01880 [Eubacteriales bacterium]|nr:hypothetical protein [Eubacteriales bacterium]